MRAPPARLLARLPATPRPAHVRVRITPGVLPKKPVCLPAVRYDDTRQRRGHSTPVALRPLRATIAAARRGKPVAPRAWRAHWMRFPPPRLAPGWAHGVRRSLDRKS